MMNRIVTTSVGGSALALALATMTLGLPDTLQAAITGDGQVQFAGQMYNQSLAGTPNTLFDCVSGCTVTWIVFPGTATGLVCDPITSGCGGTLTKSVAVSGGNFSWSIKALAGTKPGSFFVDSIVKNGSGQQLQRDEYSLTVFPGLPATLTIFTGATQTVNVNTNFAALSVQLTDSFGNGDDKYDIQWDRISGPLVAFNPSNGLAFTSSSGGIPGGATMLGQVLSPGTLILKASVPHFLNVTPVTFTITAQTPCGVSVNVTPFKSPPQGGSGSTTVGSTRPDCSWTATSNNPFVTITSGASGTGLGNIVFQVSENTIQQPRTATITVKLSDGTGAQTFTINQDAAAPCSITLSASSASFPLGGGSSNVDLTASNSSCPWTVTNKPAWINVTTSGAGSTTLTLNVLPNTGAARNVTLTIGGQSFTITQLGVCAFTLDSSSLSFDTFGGSRTIAITASDSSCAWTASSPDSWVLFTSPASGTGSGTLGLAVLGNPGASSRTSVLTIAGQSVTVTEAGTQPPGLRFVPLDSCRVLDTRIGNGPLGGPFLSAGVTRLVPMLSSSCGVPSTAAAYSLNVTVVPRAGTLGYLTVWPAGQAQPFVSTLNSPDGSVLANAALIPAGTNGAINAFALNDTELVIDINGYFVPSSGAALQFYPLTPCRLLDTRNPAGSFGGPAITGGTIRALSVLSGTCGVPASAAAYSLNVTAVPLGPLGFLTVWPTGRPQPNSSTLNSLDGAVLANAAIVSAGTDGAVTFFASNTTNLVVDINGYFAPPGSVGLDFHTVTPCRVVDTRSSNSPLGGPVMNGNSSRTFPLSSACGLPSTAAAYSLNITVVPSGPLGFLTAWPSGVPQPGASTLNAPKGLVLANAALVPTGVSGAVDVFVLNTTQVIIDTNGYFSR